MELHKNTANAFVKYLVSHGYPPNSIVFEWGSGDFRADIAVLDTDANVPVAIYEVKGRKDDVAFRMGVKQLKRYIDFIDLPITCGLVFSKREFPYFEYCDITDIINGTKQDSLDEVEFHSGNYEPLNYHNMMLGVESSIKDKSKEKKKKYIDWFKIFCWLVIPIVSGILMALDKIGCWSFTSERMIIYGVCLLCSFIPFVSEIKYGDLCVKLPTREPKRRGGGSQRAVE